MVKVHNKSRAGRFIIVTGNERAELHTGACSSVGMWRGTDRHAHTRSQTAVTTVHFASNTTPTRNLVTCAKCVDCQITSCDMNNLFMVALWNRADHIYFHAVVCSFFLYFSSPNLSRRRLDICHTSTHGVALVRI